MSKERAARLLRTMSDIGDDLVEEAGTAWRRKKAPAWWGELVAGLCLVALAGIGAWRWMGMFDKEIEIEDLPPAVVNTDASDPGPDQLPPDNCDVPGAAGGTLPGGITPVLRVGGALYEWAGMSVILFLDDNGSYCAIGNGETYLPEGFHEYGAINGVTGEKPAEELQLQAGFEASGTVFVSEEHPAVVYVLMTTGWFENSYIRFVSEALGDNELLSWRGRTYRFSYRSDVTETLSKLPKGCELIGTLHFVGDDSIPEGNLETNRRSDSYSKPIEGREVYAVPGDDSVLYVYERRYWSGGDYPSWRACHLWEQ